MTQRPPFSRRYTFGICLATIATSGACAHEQAGIRVHPGLAAVDLQNASPSALSSPVDCAASEGAEGGGACESATDALLVCAHGTASVRASATVGWRVTEQWLKAANAAARSRLRCELADPPVESAQKDNDVDGLRVPLAMPLTAARWLAVARALDEVAVADRSADARAWAVLDRREQALDQNDAHDGAESQRKATRVTTQWRTGEAQCTTVTELFRDRAMTGSEAAREAEGGVEDASSMDWLESDVTGAFGLKVARHPQLGYVLEAFHEQHVESGLRAGLLSVTKLMCSARRPEVLTGPPGFTVSLRPGRSGQVWIALATPSE